MDLSENKNLSYQGVRHPWESARWLVVNSLLQSKAIANGDFIDVGCGDVFVASQIVKNYLNSRVACVDRSFDHDGEFEAHPNLFLYSSLETVPKDRKFSTLLCMDVIEHNKDDHQFVTDVINALNLTDDATLLFTAPAFQFLFSEHDRLLGHHRRYTAGGLKQVLERGGLVVIESGYFFFSLFLVRMIQKLLWRTTSSDGSSQAIWRGGHISSKLLTVALFWDFKIFQMLKRIGLKLPGLSTFAICRIPTNTKINLQVSNSL